MDYVLIIAVAVIVGFWVVISALQNIEKKLTNIEQELNDINSNVSELNSELVYSEVNDGTIL